MRREGELRNRLAMDAPNEFSCRQELAGMAVRRHPGAKRTATLTDCQPVFTFDWLTRAVDGADCCPWGVAAGRRMRHAAAKREPRGRPPLYTAGTATPAG